MPRKNVDAEEDIESIESSTDDLIRDLVEKYAGSSSTPQNVSHQDEEQDQDAVEELEEKPKGKRKRVATEKQKEHLKKTRELALQKRKEYAAQRKAQKQAEEKEAYEKELARLADLKLKEKVAKVANVLRSARCPATTSKALKPVPEKPTKIKKRVIIEESEDESDESVEIVRVRGRSATDPQRASAVPKRTKKKKTPIPKPKPPKPRAVPRNRDLSQRSPSPASSTER